MKYEMCSKMIEENSLFYCNKLVSPEMQLSHGTEDLQPLNAI